MKIQDILKARLQRSLFYQRTDKPRTLFGRSSLPETRLEVDEHALTNLLFAIAKKAGMTDEEISELL